MDISIYYFGTAGPFHASKPLWLRQADIVLEAPNRAMLVDAIRAAATHVGINAPIPENIVTLVWTGARGEVGIVGGRPQPRPEPVAEREEPAPPTRQSVTTRTPISLSVLYGAPYTVQQLTMQPQQIGPSWLGASYVNGQNYVGQYYQGGTPVVMQTSGPLSAVYQHGNNYVGDWYGTGTWVSPGIFQQQAVLGPPVMVQAVANVAAEIVHQTPAPAVPRPPRQRAAMAPEAEPAEPARVEVKGEVSRERLPEMMEDGLRLLEVTAGMGLLELHVLVDVDGVEWGGVIPPVRATAESVIGGGSERDGGQVGGSEPGAVAAESEALISQQGERGAASGTPSRPESHVGGENRSNAGGSVGGDDNVPGV
ncbi:hypothetical protein F5X68DRAFT_234748 [Plectosphaerella plurivora]|uniref:Uncharacterized protein n=1 Tax=Plectosphaerella plurivora TaxID=936078 RepID=A0A9P8V487_9PEZI|nr:hypothetical protein F5X68DRAFT_234748 [Plectosphaerella plurivora]